MELILERERYKYSLNLLDVGALLTEPPDENQNSNQNSMLTLYENDNC